MDFGRQLGANYKGGQITKESAKSEMWKMKFEIEFRGGGS